MSGENEETEEDEPTRCRKCGSHYNLRVGEDPTPYCDWCAHKVVEELTAKLAAAEKLATNYSERWTAECKELRVKLTEAEAELVERGNGFYGRLAAKKIVEARELSAKLADAERHMGEINDMCDIRDGGGTTASCIGRKIVRLYSELDAAIARAEVAENRLKMLPADWMEDSSLETWFPLAAALMLDIIAERDALRREVEAMKADKERLDWLESVASESHYLWTLQTPKNYPYVAGCVFLSKSSSSGHLTAREAIDAARQTP